MDNWGLTEQGYYRPAYNEILDAYERRAKELFGSGINLTARSPLGIFLRIYAWVTGKLWQVSEDIYNAGYIDTAVGVSLYRLGAVIGLRPLSAAKAVGELTITGTAGVTVPAGFIVSATNNSRFVVLAEGVIGAGGTVTVPAQAYETGPDGNVAAGAIATIVTPITGITAVSNAAAFAGGRVRETDAEFRARYYRSVQSAGGANEDAIRDEILAVTGVTAVTVYSNTTAAQDSDGLPPHSIECVVSGGQDLAVGQAIHRRKAAGIATHGSTTASVVDASGVTRAIRFSRPTPVSVWVQITGLSVASGYTAAGVQADHPRRPGRLYHRPGRGCAGDVHAGHPRDLRRARCGRLCRPN